MRNTNFYTEIFAYKYFGKVLIDFEEEIDFNVIS